MEHEASLHASPISQIRCPQAATPKCYMQQNYGRDRQCVTECNSRICACAQGCLFRPNTLPPTREMATELTTISAENVMSDSKYWVNSESSGMRNTESVTVTVTSLTACRRRADAEADAEDDEDGAIPTCKRSTGRKIALAISLLRLLTSVKYASEVVCVKQHGTPARMRRASALI